jgi:hypothetical protein
VLEVLLNSCEDKRKGIRGNVQEIFPTQTYCQVSWSYLSKEKISLLLQVLTNNFSLGRDARHTPYRTNQNRAAENHLQGCQQRHHSLGVQVHPVLNRALTN